MRVCFQLLYRIIPVQEVYLGKKEVWKVLSTHHIYYNEIIIPLLRKQK